MHQYVCMQYCTYVQYIPTYLTYSMHICTYQVILYSLSSLYNSKRTTYLGKY